MIKSYLMTITNEPLVPGQPVKFKVQGFPEEAALRASIERFYGLKADADRHFLIFNTFEEQIFSGLMDEEGKIQDLTAVDRSSKIYNGESRQNK